jgi:hypothetical protein
MDDPPPAAAHQAALGPASARTTVVDRRLLQHLRRTADSGRRSEIARRYGPTCPNWLAGEHNHRPQPPRSTRPIDLCRRLSPAGPPVLHSQRSPPIGDRYPASLRPSRLVRGGQPVSTTTALTPSGSAQRVAFGSAHAPIRRSPQLGDPASLRPSRLVRGGQPVNATTALARQVRHGELPSTPRVPRFAVAGRCSSEIRPGPARVTLPEEASR